MASRNGNQKIVQSLISNGADVNLSDKTGKTPLDRARERDNLEVVTILLNHGAEDSDDE